MLRKIISGGQTGADQAALDFAIENNILDSDGTLIVSHGKIKGGTALTRKLAKKHRTPWIFIDLNKTSPLEANNQLQDWVKLNDIHEMNVAGARASKDPVIYNAVKNLLASL